MKKIQPLPRIGMRMIKTAVAVFFALIVSYFRPGGMPIFSAITTIICMQPSTLGVKETSVNRVIGTIMGAVFGLLTLLLFEQFDFLKSEPYHSGVIALFIIPVIYVTVLFKRPATSSLTAITFLSVVIFRGDQSVYMYAFNRMIDTFIGIVIGYVINGMWVPRHKNKETLFVTAFDEVLACQDGELSNFTKVNLNRLLEDEAAITIATHRTPSTLLPKIKEVDFNLPLIVMNGAAIYDPEKRIFPFHIGMDSEKAIDIIKQCNDSVKCYQYAIMHDELHVFCEDNREQFEQTLYENLLSREFQSYIKGSPPDDISVLYILFIGETADVKIVEDKIKNLSIASGLNIIREDNLEKEGYSNLEISSIYSSKEDAVKWLMDDHKYNKLVAFGAGLADKELLNEADKAYLVGDSVLKETDEDVSAKSIGSNENDVVMKKIKKLYYD